MARDPHSTLKQELLVRYLDAWTPTVLRSHRRASYLESGPGFVVAAALRVFGEFADRLAGHRLEVTVLGGGDDALTAVLDELGHPPGLSVRTADPGEIRFDGPVLAHLDLTADGSPDEPAAWRLVERVAESGAGEVLLALPSVDGAGVTDHRDRLRRAGLGMVAHAELVDDAGRAQLLMFAAGSQKHLAEFKEVLWAVDEYAGIRYRDPRDREGTLIDISLSPPLLPLRRALLTELARRGEADVKGLRDYTLRETLYRPEQANRVLATLVTAGVVARTPEKGRLTLDTVVRLRRPTG